MTNSQTELNMAFNKLPGELQDFIMSDENAESIHTLGDKYKIPVGEKYDAFSMGIFALLIGLSSAEKFKLELMEKCGVGEDDVNSVLVDVDELFLDPASLILDGAILPEGAAPLPLGYGNMDHPIQINRNSMPYAAVKMPSAAPGAVAASAPASISRPTTVANQSITPEIAPKILPSIQVMPQKPSDGPVPLTPKPQPSIMDTKLSAPATSMPKVEVTIGKPQMPSQEGQPGDKKTGYSGTPDPYREAPTA